VELRRVEADGWALWREVRLDALAEAPYAFSATVADWSGEGDNEPRWRQRLEAVPLNLVAFVDGAPAGQASGTAVDEDGCVEVLSMWVAPSARGLGVGVGLLNEIAAWAGDQGASAVKLAVKRANDHAIALYHRAGFCRIAEPAARPDEEHMLKPLP
jgi:ribosomal protein S18 acetylase RimI-like enzyme